MARGTNDVDDKTAAYIRVFKYKEKDPGGDRGKVASTAVHLCIEADLSVAKRDDVFSAVAAWPGIKMGVLKDMYKELTAGSVPDQKETLLSFLEESDLWHDQDSTGFASFERDGHRETVRLKSKRFQNWLHWRFHVKTGGACGSDTMRSVIALAEARAFYEGTEHRSWIRVAEHDGRLYLDLGDEAWTIIEIDGAGWRVSKEPPVRFRRGGGHTLPPPVAGGSVKDLWDLINVTDEDDRRLLLVWLTATFRPERPFPILDLSGETGSTKTTAMRVLRRLIDPCAADGRGMPKSEDDLMVAASNNWIFSADNVSGFDRDMANALCRLATGGGISKRELYTDGDEFTLDALRPIIMTGLSQVSEQQDLLDRMILVRLPVMDEADMQPEDEFWARYEERRPQLLGALLDAVSTAIRRLPEVKLTETPRMADFTKWGEAIGKAFGWKDGDFLFTYKKARSVLLKTSAESDLLTHTIVRYLNVTKGHEVWATATELLVILNEFLGDDYRRKTKEWPTNAVWMGKRLNARATGLRAAGVSFEMVTDPDRGVNLYRLAMEVEDTATGADEVKATEDEIPF